MRNLVTKYLGSKRRAGKRTYQHSDLSWEQDLFPKSKFGDFTKRVYHVEVVRNVEQELGNLYSMSWARKDYFGNKISNFETEFRHKLLAIKPDGKFNNKLVFEAFFLVK